MERLSSVVDGDGQAVSYGYDPDSEITSIGYPNGKTVTQTYDGAGHETAVTDWNGNTTTYAADADGNTTSEVLPNGVTSASQYNADDQVTSISDAKTSTPQTPFATFGSTRNLDNQVTAESDTGVPPPETEAYTYSAAGQLTSDSAGSYQYDPAGNVTKTSAGNAQQYNQAEELASSSSGSSQISLVGTSGVGSVTGYGSLVVSLPHGIEAGDQILVGVTETGSQTANTPSGYTSVATASNSSVAAKVQLFRRTAAGGETTVSLSFTYGSWSPTTVDVAVYRGVNSTNPVDGDSTATVSAGYTLSEPSITTTSNGDRIVAIDGAGGPNTASWTAPSDLHSELVESNPANEQTQLSDATQTSAGATGAQSGTFSMPVPLAGILVALRPATGNVTYTYNSQGDRTAVNTGSGMSTLGYNQINQLISANGATYSYNGDGLRTATSTGGTAEPFTWSTNTPTGNPELLQDGSTDYIYGPDGSPLEQISSAGTLYYLHDQLGSTRLITSSTGTTDTTYTYTAYGTLAGTTGSLPAGDTNPFGYAGAYTDPATGYLYLINRYYDPTTAQFLTVDPAVDVTDQAYQYVDGDPLNAVDPDGLLCLSFHCLLSDLSTVAGAVSAVTALIPGLDALSLAAAAVAVAADGVNCLTGDCDWIALALDVASLIPGFAALKFGGQAEEDAALLKAIEAVGLKDPSLANDEWYKELIAKLNGRAGSALSAISVSRNLINGAASGNGASSGPSCAG